MKKVLFIIISSLLTFQLSAQISIVEIQYTSQSIDGSYPSSYQGQMVTTGGIVVANKYSGNRFFIASSAGGAWSGLFIYDNRYAPEIGDSVILRGTVYEYNGYTEIKDLSSFEIVSSNNPLPKPTKISTKDISNEAYEGVLVELNTCTVSSAYDAWGNWKVNDGSGQGEISTEIFNLMEYGFPIMQNYSFNRIAGVVGINYGYKKLHPRGIQDIQSSETNFIVSTKNLQVDNEQSVKLPIKISILNQSGTIQTYSIEIEYNESVFEYKGYDKDNTISSSGIITEESSSGSISIQYTGNANFDGIDTLINLMFTPIEYGNANLKFTKTLFDGNSNPFAIAGELEYISSECNIPIADTLTIIQRPLLNIPAIAVPGEEFIIECFASQTVTDWKAELIFDNNVVPLTITQTTYNAQLDKWSLKALIPETDLYELYDLKISASGGLTDTVVNAVKILDKYKNDYYFVHITDTHLPNHQFYGEDGYETDSSELTDFYEVIKDINLIQPEFVLLTGDLINEGELEDFECLRNHTLTVHLLEKFEVPVYIVPGNHDLGGWNDTPPSQGTARREWWRFFGWRQRTIPPIQTEYLTHDYSFDYGKTHFVGLEAYDNYDSYMYETYGSESFISSQLTWLENDLAAAGDKTKVLFYHYDFKNQLNHSELGIAMALWGHNHKNTGDINAYPTSLSTASVCDGKRTFRLIRVNDGNLQAENAVQTHSNGDKLSIHFDTPNNGSLDIVSATIMNDYYLNFSNGLVKFIMPNSEHGYLVNNGTLMQVLKKDSYSVCYVKVSIPANDHVTVSVEKKLTGITEEFQKPVLKIFPNPFSEHIFMEYKLQHESEVSITVYNTEGKKIKTLVHEVQGPDSYKIKWNASSLPETILGTGIYIISLKLNGEAIWSQQVLCKRN